MTTNEDLCLLYHQLELIYKQNGLIACYLSQLIPKLERFTMILEQLLVPAQTRSVKIRRLSSIKGIKKVIIKQLNIHQLEHLEFNLDNIDVEELSGALNIGISEEFNVKHLREKSSPTDKGSIKQDTH